jgi:hypothetical protein
MENSGSSFRVPVKDPVGRMDWIAVDQSSVHNTNIVTLVFTGTVYCATLKSLLYRTPRELLSSAIVQVTCISKSKRIWAHVVAYRSRYLSLFSHSCSLRHNIKSLVFVQLSPYFVCMQPTLLTGYHVLQYASTQLHHKHSSCIILIAPPR